MNNALRSGPDLEDVLAPYGSLDMLQLVSKVGKGPPLEINQSGLAHLSAVSAVSAVKTGPEPV